MLVVSPEQAQELTLAEREPLAGVEGPLLVRVERQQLTAVHVDGTLGGGGVAGADRGPGSGVELVDVDRQLGVREQGDRVTRQHDAVGHARRFAYEMSRLVEPVGDRVGGDLRPERINDLLAMHAPTGCQCQQLDEQRRVPAVELGRLHRSIVDDDLELAQHADAHAHDRVLRIRVLRVRRERLNGDQRAIRPTA